MSSRRSRRPSRISLAAVLCSAGLACVEVAAAVPLPDLAPPRTMRIELRWSDQPAGPTAVASPLTRGGDDDGQFHQMTAVIPIVEHRFDVRRWRGRQVQISLVVPALVEGLGSTTGMIVKWDGGSVFGAGRARPGERVPVFAGRIDSDQLLERLRFELLVDSRFFDGRIRFSPAFELEER